MMSVQRIGPIVLLCWQAVAVMPMRLAPNYLVELRVDWTRVIVLDASVLIAHMNPVDSHHDAATAIFASGVYPGICSFTPSR